jgi:Tfp pilus assembly protein PilZ
VNEKRIHPRVPVSVSVTFELADGSEAFGTASDVSMGGMFIETADPPAFGAKVTIVCRLDETGPSNRLAATVRWNKPGGVGVQFGLLGARDTHAIATFLKRGRP